MEILTYSFETASLPAIKNHKFGQNWPVVYLIHNKKDNKPELYVGETTSAIKRVNQHLVNPERRKMTDLKVIFDNKFNKSAILDIEQTLIQMFLADQKYTLQNRNGGQSSKHDYYQRAIYQNMVDDIWDSLYKCNFTNSDSSVIRNSNLFKYSPYNTLTPEQEKVSFEILNHIMDCLESGKKGTSVLQGRAGTGKSILIIHMIYSLVKATEITYNDNDLSPEEYIVLGYRVALHSRIADYVALHGHLNIGFVVPMTSIRLTFKKVFGASKDAGLQGKMVIGPQEALKQDYDILFVDEAHRLARRKSLTSYGSFDDACRGLGIDPHTSTQLDMIQASCKYSVLVYDENQTVKSSDLTPDQFTGALSGRSVMKSELTTQMRCSGGAEYIDSLDNLFSCKEDNITDFKDFDFQIFNNPNELISNIRSLDLTFGLCRTVAGYSWEWISKGCSNVTEAVKCGKEDIELCGKKYVWNMSNQEWILRQDAVNEIGCIHTTQGYDLNYVGVILGREIDFDPLTNSITINRDLFYDAKVKANVDDSMLKTYIINSYKVMMSRGIKGCYIYAYNQNLQKYLRKYFQR